MAALQVRRKEVVEGKSSIYFPIKESSYWFTLSTQTELELRLYAAVFKKCSATMRLWILPVAVRGSSSAKKMRLGILNAAKFFLQYSWMSFSVASCPLFNTIPAFTCNTARFIMIVKIVKITKLKRMLEFFFTRLKTVH